MSLKAEKNGSVTLDNARRIVCLESAWEIEAIASMLPDVATSVDEDSIQLRLRVRCLAARLRELSRALMAGLDDSSVPVRGVSGLSVRVLLSDEELQ